MMLIRTLNVYTESAHEVARRVAPVEQRHRGWHGNGEERRLVRAVAIAAGMSNIDGVADGIHSRQSGHPQVNMRVRTPIRIRIPGLFQLFLQVAEAFALELRLVRVHAKFRG